MLCFALQGKAYTKLQLLFITQTCLCNILQFFTAVKKNDNFQIKICDVFLIFAQIIDCGYTIYVLEQKKKYMNTPVNPGFSI